MDRTPVAIQLGILIEPDPVVTAPPSLSPELTDSSRLIRSTAVASDPRGMAVSPARPRPSSSRESLSVSVMVTICSDLVASPTTIEPRDNHLSWQPHGSDAGHDFRYVHDYLA